MLDIISLLTFATIFAISIVFSIYYIKSRKANGKSNKGIIILLTLLVIILIASFIIHSVLITKDVEHSNITYINIDEIYNHGEFFIIKTETGDMFKVSATKVYKGDSDHVIRYTSNYSDTICFWIGEPKNSYTVVLKDPDNIPVLPSLH